MHNYCSRFQNFSSFQIICTLQHKIDKGKFIFTMILNKSRRNIGTLDPGFINACFWFFKFIRLGIRFDSMMSRNMGKSLNNSFILFTLGLTEPLIAPNTPCYRGLDGLQIGKVCCMYHDTIFSKILSLL